MPFHCECHASTLTCQDTFPFFFVASPISFPPADCRISRAGSSDVFIHPCRVPKCSNRSPHSRDTKSVISLAQVFHGEVEPTRSFAFCSFVNPWNRVIGSCHSATQYVRRSSELWLSCPSSLPYSTFFLLLSLSEKEL